MIKRHAGLFWLCWVLVFGVAAGCQPAFATVSTTAPRNDYVGNGATATYSYSFKIFAATDLRVTKRDTSNVETTLTYPTDYTVTGAGRANGGTITLTAGALPSDYRLTIRFDRTPRQSTDLRNQGSFYPETHEDKFDELTRYSQQIEDVVDRSLHLPETEVGTSAATTLPVAADRASKLLGFDASGNPIATENNLTAVDFVHYLTNYASLNAAVTAIGSTTATLAISSSSTVSSSVTVPSNITLWFVGAGRLSINSGQTVTINGPILADHTKQLFAGSGQANLGKSIVGYAPWWGVTAGDTTDHRVDWGKVITSLNTAGGGTVIFPPGTYRFYNNGGSTDSPGTITGATGVTILGYGATLALDTANTAWTASTTSNFLAFNSSSDIVIDGFNGTGPTLTQDGTFHGVTFVRFLQGCRNITLPSVRLSGWAAAYIIERSAGDADSYISRGINIGLVDVTNTIYGVSLQRSGNATRIGLIRSNDVYRSLIAYGLEDLDVSIESANPKGINADVLLAAQSQTGDQIPLRRVHLRYRNVDSTSTGNGAGIQFYFAGNSAAGTIEDVSLEMHLRYGGSDQMGPALLISKVLDNGSLDGTGSRGHIMRDVRISAFLRGDISTAFLGSVPISYMPGTVWTGETIENLTFERVRYVSNTATTALSISGLLTATLGGTVVFRDVDVGTNAIDVWGTSTPAAPTAGRFRFINVTASNLDDFADSTLPLRNIFANNSPVAVPLSWDGLMTINHGASGTVVYNLPAAVAGRQYRFYRKATQTMRIDPSGSEVIRGGGAGKYLSLDSDGALAALECVVDGTWETVILRGTTTFEP